MFCWLCLFWNPTSLIVKIFTMPMPMVYYVSYDSITLYPILSQQVIITLYPILFQQVYITLCSILCRQGNITLYSIKNPLFNTISTGIQYHVFNKKPFIILSQQGYNTMHSIKIPVFHTIPSGLRFCPITHYDGTWLNILHINAFLWKQCANRNRSVNRLKYSQIK